MCCGVYIAGGPVSSSAARTSQHLGPCQPYDQHRSAGSAARIAIISLLVFGKILLSVYGGRVFEISDGPSSSSGVKQIRPNEEKIYAPCQEFPNGDTDANLGENLQWRALLTAINPYLPHTACAL